MRIVLVDVVPDHVLTFALAGNVLYRPDLVYKSPSIVAAALEEVSADAVIVSSCVLDEALRTFAQGKEVCRVRVSVGPTPIVFHTLETNCVTTLHARGEDASSAYANALDALERRATTTLAPPLVEARFVPRKTRDVTLVGAGIVNLVTGFMLQAEGYAVRFVDAGPEPQADAHWTAYGCSRGGDDARMFTLSEMDNYNDKIVSPQMNGVFNARVGDLGWDVRRNAVASAAERRWLAEYELLPVWLAKSYNVDIFAFNRDSRSGWEAFIEAEPDLFCGCELREGILRLYADPIHFGIACERQDWIGATQRVLSPDEVAAFQPALAEAVAAGQIAGGIVVTGFTLNVHKFMHRLVATMRERGATFEWNRRATTLRLNDRGAVASVEAVDGPIPGDAFVVSPGAYAQALLSGTRCADKIHGVLGAWLRLPNLEPRLDQSLKLARRGHITEDANITVATDLYGEPLMIIGSGYGHTGVDPANIDEMSLHQLYAGIIDTARRFFPSAYEAARDAGSIETSLKHCVRPWTATGLGLFEILPTTKGGRCVITGGHNTGGFAQAPTIAAAVLAALAGRDHAMHRLYHPDRTASFMGRLPLDGGRAAVAETDSSAVVPFDRADRHTAHFSA